jgi:hypothetical protein
MQLSGFALSPSDFSWRSFAKAKRHLRVPDRFAQACGSFSACPGEIVGLEKEASAFSVFRKPWKSQW